MAGFKLSNFRGRYPGIERRYIHENAATVATDLKLGFGDIRPLWGYGDQHVVLSQRRFNDGPPRSLYLHNDTTWVHFDKPASFVAAPIGQDVWERLIFSFDEDGTDWPLMVAGIDPTGYNEITAGTSYHPAQYYALGAPNPTSTPSATRTSGALGDIEDQREFYYCFTVVNDRGEESAPSSPSDVVIVNEGLGFTVTVACQSATSLLAANDVYYRRLVTARLYRQYTADSSATWFFVDEREIGAGGTITFTDSVKTASLPGDAMVTMTWLPPPIGLKHVKSLPNGSLVGFRGNEVMFSEPGYPYAWPIRYRYALDFNIVGVGVFGSSVAAFTQGQPYVFYGSDPSAMTPVRMDADQSCVSRQSIVDFGDRVLWASPDGLFSVGTNGVTPLTGGYIDKRTWQAEFAPSTIHAYAHEGRYIAYYNGAGGDAGFMVDAYSTDEGVVDLSKYTTAAYRDLKTATLYIVDTSVDYPEEVGVFAFDDDEDNPLEWEWASRVYEFPAHVSPGRAQIIGSGYPFELDTAYMSDVGVLTPYDTNMTINSRNAIPLSAGVLATDWVVTVRGDSDCESIVLGETMKDIKGV